MAIKLQLQRHSIANFSRDLAMRNAQFMPDGCPIYFDAETLGFGYTLTQWPAQQDEQQEITTIMLHNIPKDERPTNLHRIDAYRNLRKSLTFFSLNMSLAYRVLTHI